MNAMTQPGDRQSRMRAAIIDRRMPAVLAWSLFAHRDPRVATSSHVRPRRDRRQIRASEGHEAGSVTQAANRIEGTVYDESGRPLADADVQLIAREFMPASSRPIDRRFTE